MENQKQSISTRYEAGQMIGCLQLIEKTDKNRWKLRCTKCGSELELNLSTISGYKKVNIDHCKYCPKKHTPRKYKIGEIYGNCFELLEYLQNNYYLVKCTKCGREQVQSMPNMKRHVKDTCYFCTHPTAERNPKEFGRKKGANLLPIDERIYNYYSSRIIANNNEGVKKFKEWSLSLEDFSKLIHGNCAYCGSSPSEDNQWNNNSKRRTSDEIVKINGIDRVDSNKGYTIDNCVSCCTKCNRMKMDLPINEFLSHVKKIADWNMCLTTIEQQKNTDLVEYTQASGNGEHLEIDDDIV